MQVRSGDAEIFYHVQGSGPAVILLHAFPLNHRMWLPALERVGTGYRCILPDLRCHGNSSAGEGAGTMARHAADVIRVMDDAGIGRAFICGVSIGGYISFELWRQCRERVAGLVLCNTKAQADTPTARAARYAAIEDIAQRGPESFVEGMIMKLFGDTTRSARPDIVDEGREMMMRNTVVGLTSALDGLAQRPDSMSTLPMIDAPTLVIAGDEDTVTPVSDAELLRANIRMARMAVVSKAGHLAVFERPQECGGLIRSFLDEHRALLQS